MDNTEKLALMSFVTKEFDLNQPLAMAGSNSAAQFILQQFTSQHSIADLIYWDSADLTSLAPLSVANDLKLLSRKGIVCIDGALNVAALSGGFLDMLEPILETPDFFVFARRDGERPIGSMRYQMDLFRRKYYVESMRPLRRLEADRPPLVAVAVLAYQHEKYITECLNSILMQKGHFRMRVIILDDASPDRTADVVSTVIADQGNERIEFDFRSHPNNIGMVKNFGECIRLAAGCDYLTFCEGDDFWSSDTRIQEHIDFLVAHPDCVMSFNTIERCAADGSSREVFLNHVNNPHDIIDGNALANENLPGNLAACFYDGILVEIIPEQLFDLYTGDWLFNMYCAQFGGVGHLKKLLSVYRQHEGGEWSMTTNLDKLLKIWELIEQYNIFLDYQYDEGFQERKRHVLSGLNAHWDNDTPDVADKFDLLILSDVFSSPYSGFRLAEFTTYLHEFPKSMLLASGLNQHVVDNKPLNNAVRKFQWQNPKLANRVMTHGEGFPIRLFKLLYVNFLINAYDLLPAAEDAEVPFVFTLYPGGGFTLNNSECNRKLKRVFDSPCFLKVIVTQQITYDYIVNHGLCPIDKIEMIFGLVMPQDAFADPVAKDKPRWGFGKTRLDICFMTHRYTPEDKGYDVFVNVVGQLCERYEDIYFHVVGPYDEQAIDVNSFRDRIVFHGELEPEQFDGFFREMDIILSPNISRKMSPGVFEGFPTASCIEAGLRGTAIFATDEFKSAAGRFTDGQDIVLLDYDPEYIVNKVKEYYGNPAELKAVGERGSHRIQDLYSYQSQMLPRVKLLRELMTTPFVFHNEKLPTRVRVQKLCKKYCLEPLMKQCKKYSPEPLKQFYRAYIKSYVS